MREYLSKKGVVDGVPRSTGTAPRVLSVLVLVASTPRASCTRSSDTGGTHTAIPGAIS